jgi:hypothetical protein
MTPSPRFALLIPLVAACDVGTPDPGIQIGALREPDPAPQPPTDFKDLDMTAAVEEALRLGGLTTLTAAWTGHLGSLDSARFGCPTMWVGPLPEDFADFDIDDEEPGMSWASDCTTDPGNVDFAGFTHWASTIADDEGFASRSLAADAIVSRGDGTVLFDFDGEASDTLDVASGTYSSLLNGELTGELAGIGTGLRTGGEFEASWSTDGTMRMFGTVTTFDGFGPPDGRKPDTSPELRNLPAWTENMPRFTSVRFDLFFDGTCNQEPIGFLGIRGNEGFWFDVYFMPDPELLPGTAEYKAFPFEEIDNIACDGVGTLFTRNVNLKTYDEADSGWSREVSPNFQRVTDDLALPSLDSYVYTLRDFPTETE